MELSIQPRPLSTEVETIRPRPIAAPESRQIAAKGKHEQDGFTQADILLRAIRAEAHKPERPVTSAALRALIVKFARQYALDF